MTTAEVHDRTDAVTVAPEDVDPAEAAGTEVVPVEAPADGDAAGEEAPTRRRWLPRAFREPREPRVRRRSLGRTTRVVVRRVEPWSVLKLSLVYYLAVFLVVLVAGVLLWAGATSIGVVENIESFMVDIGFQDFRFIPRRILGGVALGGLVLVVAGTVANVIMCALFNLMGDLTGGLKLTLQEDVPRPPRRRKDDEGDATV